MIKIDHSFLQLSNPLSLKPNNQKNSLNFHSLSFLIKSFLSLSSFLLLSLLNQTKPKCLKWNNFVDGLPWTLLIFKKFDPLIFFITKEPLNHACLLYLTMNLHYLIFFLLFFIFIHSPSSYKIKIYKLDSLFFKLNFHLFFVQ